MRKPKFVEPNRYVLQVYGTDKVWYDYASIKSNSDLKEAIMKVEGGEGYRIVEKHMGTTVIYS